MNLLSTWRAEVEARTKSPWPGPRPMHAGKDRPTDLIGRDRDARKLARLVYDTNVVIFTGASGVGKTSMLQMAVAPTLREAGYAVVVCDNWNRSTEADGADLLLLRQAELQGQLPDLVQEYTADGVSLREALDDLYPNRSVVVIDQFEQLMRYQRKEYEEVLRWIEETAARTRVRIVVSLRAEYVHELCGHAGLSLHPSQQASCELEPITDTKLVKEIIRSGNLGRSIPAISPDAVSAVLDEWKAAEDVVGSRSLLHLQALLRVLWSRGAGAEIRASDVKKLRASVASRRMSQNTLTIGSEPSSLLVHALPLAVQVGLDACAKACEPNGAWVGIDAVLAARTRDMVRSVSGHLSSGGYKVDQAREELAYRCIIREGDSRLAHSARAVERARRALSILVDESNPPPGTRDDMGSVPDWLSTPRSELFGEPPLSPQLWERLDPDEVTGGPLLDQRPEDSLLEEYRALYFALEWLRSCELVRISTAEGGQTMVSLIHDLFGSGLIKWCEDSKDASAPIHQFTAVRGIEIGGVIPGTPATVSQPIVANVRWRSCEVRAKFENVTFINCDFRGTTFVECGFRGVAFINCMLDDAEFFRCTIEGAGTSLPAPVAKRSDKIPSYFVKDVPSEMLRSLQWYREPRRDQYKSDLGLYSRTAGLAVDFAVEHADPHAWTFVPQDGGLSMFGGRVSSLKVRKCDFGVDGQIALRHVAGTSVEFADQEGARLDVEGAALRGLTITLPVPDQPEVLDEDTPRERPSFVLHFSNSRIINVWFGVGMSGEAVFDDCQCWQVFNAADRADFKVTMPSSSAYGIVNCEPVESSQIMGFSAESMGEHRAAVWSASHAIDYRRRPLFSELMELAHAPVEDHPSG